MKNPQNIPQEAKIDDFSGMGTDILYSHEVTKPRSQGRTGLTNTTL